MARQAKLIIAAEDKTKAGIASAKAGMGSLIEAAKESKRALEGINAVLQFGGWTILAAKAVRAFNDITKEAREQSTEFKNLNATFDQLRKNIGASIVSDMSPLVAWVNKVAEGWNTSLRAMANYHKSQKEFSVAAQTDAYKSLEAQLARQDLDIKKRRTQYALYENPSDAAWLRVAELDRAETISQMGEVSARIRALSSTLPSIKEIPLAGSPAAGSTGGGGGAEDKADHWIRYLPKVGREDWDRLKYGTSASWDGSGDETRYESQQKWLAQQRYRQSTPELGYQGAMQTPGDGWGPLKGLINAIAPVATMFGNMFTSLSSVQAILNPMQTIITSMFEVIGPLINDALAPLVGMLKIVGNALGQILAPVIIGLGKVINWVMEGILWVWNGIVDAINWALGWLGVNIAHATLADAAKVGNTASISTSTGASASYTGAQSITFNFYNNAPAVGDGGLEKLAELIEKLISQRARYA